ncbi:hypothetical protein [Halobaculum litoreum]|uniref:hypothetical protein n=1 Tax=Halobaculum litoreum TaxID=3031998 RepID=UPI0024C3389B|nr:hypothetical protein [Halobaculum sp. DT92]
MIRRRKYIHGLWITVLGGCVGIGGGSEQPDSPGPGAKAPWAEQESPADIIISNTRSESVTVTLSIDGDERSFPIGENDDWVSGDVFLTGEDGTVTVTTPDGLTASVDWVPEDESTNRVCVFNVDPDRIRTDMFVK